MELIVKTDDKTIMRTFINLAKSFDPGQLTYKTDLLNNTVSRWDSLTHKAIASIIKVDVDKLPEGVSKAIDDKKMIDLIREIRIATGMNLFQVTNEMNMLELA